MRIKIFLRDLGWDYRDRLIAVVVTDSSGNVLKEVEYTYDVFNRRIAKSVDSDGAGAATAEIERYILDGDHIALTFDEAGNLIERLLHGTEIDRVIAQENGNGAVNWALTDNQGSIRFVLNSVGNIVNQITYDAFGNVTLESDSSVEFRFGYTGRELDEETGLDYYAARYRDGAVGRFIGEDSVGFSAGDSNLSRYTFNSPTNFTDPSGNIPIAIVPVVLKVAEVALIGGGIIYFGNRLRQDLKDTGDGGTITLERPKPETLPKLKKPPVRPNNLNKPQPDNQPQKKPEPRYVDPDLACNKETCKDKYPQYSVLSDYIGSQFPFDGFKFDIKPGEKYQEPIKYPKPKQAKGAMPFHRQNVGSFGSLVFGSFEVMNIAMKSPELLFINNMETSTKISGTHYNVLTKNTNISAGSIGTYKFCKEGNPPSLVLASMILNIKDRSGDKYYKFGANYNRAKR